MSQRKILFWRGMTLIEALVVLAVFSIVTVAFYSAYSGGARVALDSKRRLMATAIANEQLEKLRNLPYLDVGFVDEASLALRGILPASDREKTVTDAEISLVMKTVIQNIDDPLDGVSGGSPDDLVPNDSKKVTVSVSWGTGDSDSITISTRFVPDGIETISGGGNLVVNVSESNGAIVSGATVTVKNLDTNNQTQCITQNGSCLFVGLEEETSPQYQISLSKSGYESMQTYSASATFDPVDENLSILVGALQTASFTLDRTYSIRFSPRETLDSDILNSVGYSLSGGRLLGTNPSDGNSNVYALAPTSATGQATLSSATPGTYFVTSLVPGSFSYWKLDPALVSDPFAVSIGIGGVPSDVSIVAIDESRPGVLFTVSDGTSPIADASIRLFNAVSPGGYDQTLVTDQFGKAYFPNDEDFLLSASDYSFEVSAASYSDESGSVSVPSGLLEKSVVLH